MSEHTIHNGHSYSTAYTGPIVYVNRDGERVATFFTDDMSTAERWLESEQRIAELEALIRQLEIGVMHPDMSGHHQCSIRANCGPLTPGQWAAALSCQTGDTDDV
ncbi:MAG: hypothetical protein GY925_13160 [Actinomycetia bacterium]|nr:hypothetical protein [Actinomycetes bacterium]